MYEIGINTQVIYNTHHQLATADLKNIVTVSIKVNKLAWATTFLQTHKDKLSTEDSEAIINYNLARIQYHQTNYKGALTLLADRYLDPFYHISAKILRIKILHTTEDIDRLDKAMNNFRVFMSEGKIKGTSSKFDESYRNFINFLYRIYHNNLRTF